MTALVLVAAVGLLASTPPEAPSDARTSDGERSLEAPVGRLGDLIEGLGFAFDVNNDRSALGVSLGGRFQPEFRPDASDDRIVRFSQTRWSVSAEAPIGGEDDLLNPQTLDKLSNGSTLAFELSRYSFSTRGEGGAGTGAVQFGGVSEIGFNRFGYRDQGTLDKHDDERVQYGLGAFLAYYPLDYRSRIAATVKYQHAYEARDEVVVCKTVVIAPETDCDKAPPGPAELSDGILFSLEYRRTFDIGWSRANLAVSPLVTHDADTGESGIEVPVYLLFLDDAPILPGVKFGYSTDTDEATFGVFLKSSFSLSR